MTDQTDLKRIIQCGLSDAVEAFGERWSFLILRGAFNGLVHFEEFQQTLGIARNILANRLSRLVERGILDRSPSAEDRRRVNYRLTKKGEALMPVLVALRQWGERWGGQHGCAPGPTLVDQRDLQPVRTVEVFAADGRTLHVGELKWFEPTDRDASPSPPDAPEPREARAIVRQS